MENNSFMDPNHVPDEFKVPFDMIELPSQGILYPNKKSTVKVEYLTAMDENILSSPNILNNGGGLDILLRRKVKDLGFDIDLLLDGDRIAILIFLRSTGLGHSYSQIVIDKNRKAVEGVVDLSTLKSKMLTIRPDEKGEFDYILPHSKKKVKFKLLSGVDEKEIEEKDKGMLERNDNISSKPTLRLERAIMEIEGIRDKMKISQSFKNNTITLLDIRSLNKYISEIEPGIDLKTTATTPGGESVECFLRIGSTFWYPEI